MPTVGTGYGCAKGGEDYDVGGVFFKDVGEAFADWSGHCEEFEEEARGFVILLKL